MKTNMILLVVSCALMMESIDATVINTAIPAMSQSLHVNPIDLKLALISYLLSLAIFIPISGWLADKFGTKKIFMMAIVVFTASSIWCGFSDQISELVIARMFQGLGGSLMLPLGRLIIVRTYPRHELISKMNIVVMIAAIGMMLGPLIGGTITQYFSWRWIFWVNVPIGVFSLWISQQYLPNMAKHQVHPLDKLGFFLFGFGLALLTFGLAEISETHGTRWHALLTIGISLLLLFIYTKHSHRKTNPIVNIDLFRTRTFCVSTMGNLFARLAFGGLPFVMPLFLQICLGYSPQLSGLLLVPTVLGMLLIKLISLPIMQFLGYKKFLILNTLMLGFYLCIFYFVNSTTSVYTIGVLTFIYGCFISLQYTGVTSLGYATLAEENLSAATSIMSTIQQLAQSFGVAMAAILITFFSIGDELTIPVVHKTFIAMGILTLLSTFIFLPLKANDGEELIQK